MSSVANCVIPSNVSNALQNAGLGFFAGEAFSQLLATVLGEGKAAAPTGEKTKSEAGHKEDTENGAQMDLENVVGFVLVQVPVEVPQIQTATMVRQSDAGSNTTEPELAALEKFSQKSSMEKRHSPESADPMDALIQAIAESSIPVGGAQEHKMQNSDQQGSAAPQSQKANPEGRSISAGDSQSLSSFATAGANLSAEASEAVPTKLVAKGTEPNRETEARLPLKHDLEAKPQVTFGDNSKPATSVAQTSKAKPVVEITEVRGRSSKQDLDPTDQSKSQVGAVHAGADRERPPKNAGISPNDAIAPAEDTDVNLQLPARTAMHLERITERLTGTEFHFGFASSDAGVMKVTATVRAGTVDVGVAAERVETASALKAEVPVLESNLREHSMHLGEINIGSQASMNASMHSDGQRRGRPEYLPAQIVSNPAPDPNSSVAEETTLWVGRDRSSVSLLA